MKGFKGFLLLAILILSIASIQGCGGGKEDTEGAQKGAKSAAVKPSATDEATEEVGMAEEPEDVRELKIGVIGPLTGDKAIYGKSVLEGVKLAIERVNAAGGINGKKVELVSYDNKGELETTIDGISHLIDDEHVLAILSSPTGWSTFAPTHQINQTRTLFFSVGTKRNIERSGAFIFRVGLPDEIAVEDLIELAINRLGYRRYALVTSSIIDYSLARSYLFKNAILQKGGTVVIEADTYNTYEGRGEIDSVVSKLKSASGIDAIIYTGNAEEGGRFVKSLRAAGVELPVIGTEVFSSKEFTSAGGDAIRGTLYYTAYAPELNDATRDFATAYRKATGREPDVYAALAYDTSLLLMKAVEQADSTVPSRVMDALIGIEDFSGITGKMSFTPQGEPIKHPFIYRVEKGGEKGTILVK